LIEDVIRRAGVDPGSISYVEAAATGAALGDALEIKALQKVLGKSAGESACAIGSVKSAIGHAEAASGLSQVVKVVEQLRHRQLAPIVVPGTLNPNLELEGAPFYLQTHLQAWQRSAGGWPRRALINSFGAGGSYASLILEEHVPQPETQALPGTPAPEREEIIILSARDDERLTVASQRLLHHLDAHPETRLDDLAYTLQVGREPMSARVAWVVRSKDELRSALRTYSSGDPTANLQTTAVRALRGETLGQQSLQSLLSGDVGQAIAMNLIAERNLPQIAALWTQGAQIAWERLHDGARHIIVLPTYPFRRERFDMRAEGGTSMHGDSQLAGSRAESPSSDKQSDSVRQFLEYFLARELGISAVGLQARRPLGEYGVDSLIGRRLLRGLDETFGVSLSGRLLQENFSIGALVPLVAGLLQRRRKETDTLRSTLQVRFMEQLLTSTLSNEEIERLIEQGSLV
jgi:acyl transferase domain-containing protein